MCLFEGTCAAMGLKGVPAKYFQRVMATMVFAILELYLDDVIVDAQSIDELCRSLEIIFARLRKHNII